MPHNGNSSTSEEPHLLLREGQYVAQLNMQAHDWLGERYTYYNKIRQAGTGFSLFSAKNLEELMEATRSALSLVTKTLNGRIAAAYNQIIDEVSRSGTAESDWPHKIEFSDRNNPPMLGPREDALILAWHPLCFINLAKQIRDKGRGLDLYGEGLIKKLYFKVIGYYADPSHWNIKRIGFMLAGLPKDASALDVNNKLVGLKSELELFVNSYSLFKFGRPPRGTADAAGGNTVEDAFDVSPKELVRDLFLQHFIVVGMEQFLFRYYAFLLAATDSTRAMRTLSIMFDPVLARVAEIRLQFQASFLTEAEKARFRRDYQAFAKKHESQHPVENVEVKGHTVRRIHYSLRLLEFTHLARCPTLTARQSQTWSQYLKLAIIDQQDAQAAQARMIELLNTMVRSAKFESEGRKKVANTMRTFAEHQETIGLRQNAENMKKLAEAKRKKMGKARKFKRLKQVEMAETVTQEAQALERKGLEEIKRKEQRLAKQRANISSQADQIESAVHDGGPEAAAQAAAVFGVVTKLDQGKRLQNDLVGYLLTEIREGKDTFNYALYRQLFTIFPTLLPTQKIMLRKALEPKLGLSSEEMQVSEEEREFYQNQIATRKSKITAAVPEVMALRVSQGIVQANIEELLGVGITAPSLHLLFQIPFNPPNKPAKKLPSAVVQKLVSLNALINPFPEVDLLLPNRGNAVPAAQRLNMNRLAKVLAESRHQTG